jgi:hypothetical protein
MTGTMKPGENKTFLCSDCKTYFSTADINPDHCPWCGSKYTASVKAPRGVMLVREV